MGSISLSFVFNLVTDDTCKLGTEGIRSHLFNENHSLTNGKHS